MRGRTIAAGSALLLMVLAAAASAQPVSPAGAAVEVRAKFICSDGTLLDVLFRNPTHLALVERGGTMLTLYQSPVADGFRYIGGENELRGKGTAVTFRSRGQAPVTCAAAPAVPTPGTMTGTIAYRERMALPPGATATVELRDTGRADTPAPLLASTAIAPAGNQVPLHWLLGFDPAKIDPRTTYTVSARIAAADGKLLWITDTQHPVLTRGAPADDIDIAVVRAGK